MKALSFFKKWIGVDDYKKSAVLQYGSLFLCSLLGALLVFMVGRAFEKPRPQIGVVNITGIVDQFIQQEALKNLSPEDLQKEVGRFGKQLNKELQEFSKNRHMIVFPSEAIIAGANDYTGVIYQKFRWDKEKNRKEV